MSNLAQLFQNLGPYKDYLSINPFHVLLGLNLNTYGDLDEKNTNSQYHNVDPNLKEAFSAELDDLIRLHYLATSRKVTTILEFGVGKSSIVFDHALEHNKNAYEKFVSENLRRANKFECHSVDNNQKWIDICQDACPTPNVSYHYSECSVSTFNGRICTYFESIPNICPDLIYLDGPDQYSPVGDVRGVSTRCPDKLPMVGDILAIEHFLLPGTLIVVDGRTANARFIKSNFQRDWAYWYSQEFDQHFFELTEEPLGVYNKKQIDFCLGDSFYKRKELYSCA